MKKGHTFSLIYSILYASCQYNFCLLQEWVISTQVNPQSKRTGNPKMFPNAIGTSEFYMLADNFSVRFDGLLTELLKSFDIMRALIG